MTYCIGLKLGDGLVLLSDTRTNAGVDNISRFSKMFTWQVPGERAIAIATAGNLSITQGIITKLQKAIADSGDDPEVETILNAPTMYRCAQIVGDAMRDVQDRHRKTIMEQGATADATILLGGQRRGGRHRLFLVYTAGNFIEATDDTPFFQLGEHKYGKPILDRVIDPTTSIPTALKAALVSMDSTIRSNLSVGMPLDLTVIRANEFDFNIRRRIESDDSDFQNISSSWSEALRAAFHALPEVVKE